MAAPPSSTADELRSTKRRTPCERAKSMYSDMIDSTSKTGGHTKKMAEMGGPPLAGFPGWAAANALPHVSGSFQSKSTPPATVLAFREATSTGWCVAASWRAIWRATLPVPPRRRTGALEGVMARQCVGRMSKLVRRDLSLERSS